jgi:Mn-dependent DtxR family transcriptional regulator
MKKNAKPAPRLPRFDHTSSQEDYLETVYVLSRNGDARNIDIAAYLDRSRASVSRGMALLLSEGLITIDDAHIIRLTDRGNELAEAIYERHMFFKEVLKWAGLDEKAADREACLMEHALSDAAFTMLKNSFLNLKIL